jgi:ABC-2 type transport system ATP-binding protein
MMGTGARIQTRRLSRRFGDHVALHQLDLDIEPGETFGLLGANGAGKTTVLRLVTGHLVATEGQVTVDGISPADDAPAVHRRLGFVAETPRLYPELRVRGFLRFAGGIKGLSGQALREAVERALDRFHLHPVAKRLVGNLSKGYRQRLSLAQAFLSDPSLLIIDEPTSGLDPVQRAEVRQLIAEMRGQRTVLLSTHDLAEARQLTSRVAILYQGRLVAQGPSEEVLGGDNPLALFRGQAEVASERCAAPAPGARHGGTEGTVT